MDNIEEVRKYLEKREPIFHHREYTNTRGSVDNEMHADFFEISASGKLYTRDFVLNYLEERYKKEPVDEMIRENWKILNFNAELLADDIYMATYILDGQNRLTRRMTLWKGNLDDGFKILYHQGTVIKQ